MGGSPRVPVGGWGYNVIESLLSAIRSLFKEARLDSRLATAPVSRPRNINITRYQIIHCVSTKSKFLLVGIACACAGCVCDGEVGLGGTAVDGDHRVVLHGYTSVRDMCRVKSHCAENYYLVDHRSRSWD
jgi:hypothetical protein